MESQLKRYFALQLGPLLAGESVDLASSGASLAGGVTRADVTDEGVCAGAAASTADLLVPGNSYNSGVR